MVLSNYLFAAAPQARIFLKIEPHINEFPIGKILDPVCMPRRRRENFGN
jgi:hypothetical protein